MRYYPAKEIVPGVWIGSGGDQHNPNFMRAHGIGLVVNATKYIENLNLPSVDYYRIPVDDTPRDAGLMYVHFPVVVRDIDRALSLGKNVLVACRAGMQRSATVVAAYLMYKFRLPARKAMESIKSTKNETFWPVPTFSKSLAWYERDLKNQRGIAGQ